ncbi:MAG TPA: DUF1552 domain-containing protein [Vicinamibacterales bacterium]|nr:DUF1552 domain-containing protein [Vicinamibacterales bacterium]
MFLTRHHLSRRTVLRGMGATIALPFLDAMAPAGATLAQNLHVPVRLIAMEMVHGSAGSTAFGIKQHMWAPAGTGSEFDLSPTSLKSLEPYRDYLTIVSNTDCRNAEAFLPPEIGADHFRSAAVFLTQARPKQTQGSDVFAGTSLDQIYAQKFGQQTPIPSMQLCIENVDQAGGCSYNYSCVYTDTISWASPTDPMPMTRDPRAVFDQLFGVGATPEARQLRRRDDRSILDWVTESVNDLKRKLTPADQARLTDYLDDVREIERRIQKVEASNTIGDPRELPGAPVGVPDSFEEHVKLMSDLQALALAADITRIFSFKLSRDVSNRVFKPSGSSTAFHTASHHLDRDERVTEFQKINTYHVSLLPHLLDRLKNTPDQGGTLLDNTLVIYGSSMGNSNVHNHKRCPLILVGHAGGLLKGNMHVRSADGTPMADAMLAILQGLGVEIDRFGDSAAVMDLNSAGVASTAVV